MMRDDKAGVWEICKPVVSLDLQALVRDQWLPVKGTLCHTNKLALYLCLPEKVGQETKCSYLLQGSPGSHKLNITLFLAWLQNQKRGAILLRSRNFFGSPPEKIAGYFNSIPVYLVADFFTSSSNTDEISLKSNKLWHQIFQDATKTQPRL